MAGAMAAETTWLVMLRDVSKTIRVRGEKRVAACMVLDMDSGDMLGIHMHSSDAEAVETALRNAVREPANRQRPKSPDRIVCSPEISPRVKDLAAELGAAEVIVAPPIPEGEEIFDSFIGHMSGRKQPREFASPDEWRLLFETVLRYCEAEPWMRWGDDIDLEIEVEIDRVKQRYAGVVIGQEGIQRGLALYPGDELPAGVRDWEEGKDVAMPPGTLLLHLDPPTEPPAEFVAKADRYGWPQDADFLPVIISIGDAGPADLGRQDVRRLVLSTVAVVELDRRGPVVAASTEPIDGRLQFPDGSRGRWSIRQRLGEQPEPGTLHIRLHQVGFDLVPSGSPVSMGSMPADVLPELRRRAKIHGRLRTRRRRRRLRFRSSPFIRTRHRGTRSRRGSPTTIRWESPWSRMDAARSRFSPAPRARMACWRCRPTRPRSSSSRDGSGPPGDSTSCSLRTRT
jgi:hypothetical protein